MKKQDLIRIATLLGGNADSLIIYTKSELYEYILYRDPSNIIIHAEYEDHKKHQKSIKKYVSEHKDFIKQLNKHYYDKNRDKILLQHRERLAKAS